MKPLYRPLSLGFSILTLGFSLCTLCGFYFFNENVQSWIPCIILSSLLMFIFAYKAKTQNASIFRREILLTTGLLWVLTTLLGALPYFLILNCDISTSIFKSISGLTTTGASALENIEAMPRSLLLWHSLSQWFGGLGFVIFFISILGSADPNSKKLFMQETTFSSDTISLFNLRKNISSALGIYFLLTIICFCSLIYFKLPFFDAICHTLTTVSTGGFSIYNDGIPHINNVNIEIVLMIFMFLGGINFLFLTQIFTKSGPNLIHNYEFRFYFILIITATCLIFYALPHEVSPALMFHNALFQALSFCTTTGFHNCDFTQWPSLTLTLLLILAFIGGCSGSTAGGLKIFRLVAIFKILSAQFEKIFHPTIIRAVKIDGILWNDKKQIEVLHFFTLTIFILILGALLLQMITPQLDLATALSASVACLSNIGPGITSSIGPCQSYAFFPTAAKLLLSLFMLLGRLELYAILVLWDKKFWRKFE